MQAIMMGGAGLIVQSTFALSHQNALAMGLRHRGRARNASRDWGAAQLRTTADFQHGHWLPVTFFGGLGYQIEHHLFPRTCSIHYPAIAPIVRRVAGKYGIPYHYNATLRGAVASHYRMLKSLGEGATVAGSAAAA